MLTQVTLNFNAKLTTTKNLIVSTVFFKSEVVPSPSGSVRILQVSNCRFESLTGLCFGVVKDALPAYAPSRLRKT